MKAKKNKRERREQMQQVSAGRQDVLGMTQWRKEHPRVTWAEIEARVDEHMNQLRAQQGQDFTCNTITHLPHDTYGMAVDMPACAC
jgi:hypothetical protein